MPSDLKLRLYCLIAWQIHCERWFPLKLTVLLLLIVVVIASIFFFFFMLLSYLAAFATFHGDNYSIFNPWKKIYYEEEGKSRKAAPLLWALPGVVKREGLQQCAVPIPSSLQRLHPLPAVQWQEGKPRELEDLFCQALSKHCLLSG